MSAGRDLSIGDYALLSDSQGAALVSRTGSIDWACLPRFDAPSTFARLLGHGAGHWRLAPSAPAEVERSYEPATMVLRTVFRTATGTVAVTDAMPFLATERGHGIGQRAPHAIVRLVEGLDGDVEVESEVAPRPEYGLTVPRWQPTEGGAVCRGGPSAYVLSCPTTLEVDRGTARARFNVWPGERLGLALRTCDPWEPTPKAWSTDQVRAWLYGTVRGWQSWSSLHQGYQGPYAELVHHSGRVLQALTYAPTGAIIAAATTSLPEEVGGGRNWDYRYTWVRDASLTLSALWVAACPDEVSDFFGFFVTAAGGTCEAEDPLQILYGIRGERRVEEQELDHLDGFRQSRPVRIGNAAWRQSQLDVYGEILDAAGLYADRVASLDPVAASFLADVADRAADRWEEADHGIWEMRGERRHFLYSKLMCWVALDRAASLAGTLGGGDRVSRWCRERDRIRAAILEQGWSDKVNSFTQSFGDDDLDASALMMPIVGFLPATDPRVGATVEAITERLTDEHGLVHRYCGTDGVAGGEASFGICTYWLSHALALAGDVDAARERFECVTAYANDVDLLAEEIDGATGELLGNFPQAFTHIGLVNAANAIAEAEGTQQAS
ncbi:MAG TPA: glycoside hydrolase family 15 protein [Acidimicrobiales bacterium]|nr:glycoside hydrolase family 15 protein [Acidimicrobiales bacterium]